MISVVVPVYGVEKYLDRCLNSIVAQSYSDLEIILVDDGSKDNCPQMCDAWAEKDSRIVVIHKENGGLGSARNAGIERAVGEWISFIDSDDYIALDTYEVCLTKLEATGADICYFGYATVSKEGNTQNVRCAFPDTLDKSGIMTELLPQCFGQYPSDTYAIGSACMGVYRTDLIHSNCLRFVSERELISEDYVFTAEICFFANKVCFVDRCLYLYCENEASLTKIYRQDRFSKIVLFYENRLETIRRMGLSEDTAERAGNRFWESVTACLKTEFSSDFLTEEQKKQRFQEIANFELVHALTEKKVMQHMSWKQRILILAIRCHSYEICKMLVALKNGR